jgi:hypothetical protein
MTSDKNKSKKIQLKLFRKSVIRYTINLLVIFVGYTAIETFIGSTKKAPGQHIYMALYFAQGYLLYRQVGQFLQEKRAIIRMKPPKRDKICRIIKGIFQTMFWLFYYPVALLWIALVRYVFPR